MSMEWMDNLLGNKISKEAEVLQGKDAQEHFEKKVIAHDWIKSVSELDPEQIEKEYQAKLAEEAMTLGKTAAYEMGETPKETVDKDYKRDVSILSDYALAEMLAELRCQKEQNTAEMFSEAKEKAKKEVASSREKAEKALLDLVPDHTALDWQKAFERFSKEAKPEEPKEKDIYEPKVEEKAHDFEHPSENKFKLPTEEEMVPEGNGREADERKEVTKEAALENKESSEIYCKNSDCKAKATVRLPEGNYCEKHAPAKKEAHCGHCGKEAAPESPLKREELPVEKKADGCPVCGGEGENLGNLGQKDHFRCQGCGIMYSHDAGASCEACASLDPEIKIQASKADTIKKIAEIESPWKVITDESGQEVIARVSPETKTTKESEEVKEDELQK